MGLLACLVGCAHDDWTYRPRDGSTAVDVGSAADQPGGDVGMARDVVTSNDVVTSDDVVTGDVGMVGSDVVMIPDGGMVDAGTTPRDVVVMDVGTGPTGLRLRVQGIASTGSAPAAGSLRLTETGFELGGRACTGTLCLAGGLVP